MDHCKYLEQQFLNEKTSDIIFIVNDGRKIPAHKVLLAASSLKFEKQFNETVNLKKIEINNVSSAAFREFLYAFYSKHPEKNYTIENIVLVLDLARAFDVGFCTDTCEKFLIQNLTGNQLCSGYCIANEFQLGNLKLHCQQKIDMRKAEAFTSQSFFACSSRIFYDLINNITIRHSNEIKLIWDACLYWVQIQCGNPDNDSSIIANHLETLSKRFGGIVAENEDFETYAKQHYKHLFTSNALIDSQPHQAEFKNQHQWMVVRLLDTMLATQICSTNDVAKIELNCTKEVVLSGIAMSTVSGSPRGELSVSVRREDGESLLIVQNFNLTPKPHEPKNFVAIDSGVMLKPNRTYTIRVKLHQDVAYYRSYTVKSHSNQNDLNILFKNYKPDIFSHFLFNV